MRKTLLQLTCILLLSAAPFLAQSVTGSLSGKITNASGAAVPNAAVTVTNISTNASQKALTGPDGSFTVMGLPPGTYRVDVETAGYKRTTQQDVILSATGPAAVTIRLEAGSANETVEIRGTAPTIQTDGGEVSTAIYERDLHDLPIIDRNYQEEVGLLSGVTPPQPALDITRDPARNRFFSVNGQLPFVNLWLNDGVLNQEPYRSSAVRVQPVESVQELHVETASLPAERGFVGGGLINAMSRPGSNDWHGSLFEFYSGNILRTANPFNAVGNPDPRFVYNQFGATAGGPISRDRTFIFGSYEGTYQNGGMTQITTVPTSAMIAGNFSGVPGLSLYQPTTGTAAGAGRIPFTGNIVPVSRINPTAAAIASFLPAPNLPGFSDNYVTNVPFRNHGNKADGRIDHTISDRTNLFLRYGFTNYWAAEGSPLGQVIGAGTRNRSINQNATIGITHNFTSSLTSDLRMGYNRYDQRINMLSDQTVLGNSFGPSFANNLIGVNITGLAPIGAPAYVPENPVDNTFNWVWSWGWHSSKHNLKWGVDIRRIRADGWQENQWNLFGANGAAFFGPGVTMSATGPALSQYGALSNSFAAFLLGAPTQVGVANFLTTPTIRQSQWGAWLGDSLNLASRVSLDLGVRYEVYSPLEPRNAGGAAFFNPTNNTFNFAGIGNTGMQFSDYNLNNIAPRIGMSFRATNKTVFRAGYSVNYFQYPYSLSGFMAPMFGAATGVQGGYAAATGLIGAFGPTVTAAGTMPTTLQNGAAAGNLPAAVMNSQADTPYVQSFNAQIQQEFYWGTVLQVGYVGALDRHLLGIQELNAARPGTGVAGLPLLTTGRTASTLGFDNGLTSNFNSLQVNLNKRFSKGISFLASYTYGKALGYTSNDARLFNPFNLRSNYGPLDFDRMHSLSISHVVELPFGRHGNNIVETLLAGWQWNGVFTWTTGTPLTFTADPISCACPGETVFANLNSGVNFAGTGGASFFNPAAFSAPLNSFGNIGRGQFRGPDMTNYNMSLFKNFHVHDRFNLQLRGEAYNITNATHYAPPVTNISSPDFGRSVTTVNGSYGRQVNLALRILF